MEKAPKVENSESVQSENASETVETHENHESHEQMENLPEVQKNLGKIGIEATEITESDTDKAGEQTRENSVVRHRRSERITPKTERNFSAAEVREMSDKDKAEHLTEIADSGVKVDADLIYHRLTRGKVEDAKACYDRLKVLQYFADNLTAMYDSSDYLDAKTLMNEAKKYDDTEWLKAPGAASDYVRKHIEESLKSEGYNDEQIAGIIEGKFRPSPRKKPETPKAPADTIETADADGAPENASPDTSENNSESAPVDASEPIRRSNREDRTSPRRPVRAPLPNAPKAPDTIVFEQFVDMSSSKITAAEVKIVKNGNFHGVQTDFDAEADSGSKYNPLNAELANFCNPNGKGSNWERAGEQERAKMAERFVLALAEQLEINHPVEFTAYSDKESRTCGSQDGYAVRLNMAYANNAFGVINTLAHETWHVFQYDRSDRPKTAIDRVYRKNFDHYIASSVDLEEYKKQPVEEEAYRFGSKYEQYARKLEQRLRRRPLGK